MKISTKLICSFIAVGLLLGLQSVASYQGFSLVKNKLSLCIEQSTLVDAAMEMKYAAARDMQMVMEVLASESPEELDEFWTQHREFATTFVKYSYAIIKGDVIEKEQVYATKDEKLRQQVVDLAAFHQEQFLSPMNRLYDLKRKQLEGNQVDEKALKEADQQADSAGENIFLQLGAVERAVKTVIDQAKAEALNSIVEATRILLAVTLAGLVLAGVLGIVLGRSITGPITQAVHFTQAVSEGDLSQQLQTNKKDEMGQMATALNSMVGKLNTMLTEIIDNADHLQGASQTMSEVSGQLSTAAGNTSKKSAIVAEASEEMSTSAQNVAAAMNNPHLIFPWLPLPAKK